eukprot:4387709-Karenia_brevis.AAC.1
MMMTMLLMMMMMMMMMTGGPRAHMWAQCPVMIAWRMMFSCPSAHLSQTPLSPPGLPRTTLTEGMLTE